MVGVSNITIKWIYREDGGVYTDCFYSRKDMSHAYTRFAYKMSIHEAIAAIERAQRMLR